MLRKLIKHEWKSTCRILLPVNLSILIPTAAGCILLSTSLFQKESTIPLAVLLILAYALSLVALGSITLIYVLVRFYRNLFTEQGYLMFTLPVSPLKLFHAKLLVGFLWYLFHMVLSILSIAALCFCAGYPAMKSKGLNLESLFQIETEYRVNGVSHGMVSLQDLFGVTFTQICLYLLLLLFLGCFSSIVVGYVSILLGQLIEKHKAACAVGFYFALNILIQMVTSIAIIAISFREIIASSFLPDNPGAAGTLYHSLLSSSLFVNLGAAMLCYILSLFLMRRRINLD